jgi:beta-lactamase superfamily II metal-dependent hydrolase
MGYQVDFLQVGNGETSGDCIALRFGDLHSGDHMKQYVVVIDGGFKESGDNLVEHIIERFGTGYVDLMISTHLDRDHIAGLTPVIEKLKVGKLLMHRPWLHPVRADGDTQKEMREARKSYDQASALEELATSNGIEIIEPFAGGELQFTTDAYMHILGPDEPYYEELLKEFDHNKSLLAKALEALNAPVQAVAEVLRKIQETLDPSTETLDHVHKNTSPENSSSAIIYFNFYGHKMLFTGDAGVDALHRALDYGQGVGLDFSDLNLLDIPHHGSKHNTDTAFLDRIGAKTAFISATKDSKKHPSPRVTNALVRRGINYFTTEAGNILHHHDAPDRGDYHTITPGSLVSEFEDE